MHADTAEPEVLHGTAGRVTRDGCVLRIRTATGGTVELVDHYAEGERFVQFVFRRPIAMLGVDLVEIRHYEGGGFLLVDRFGGQTLVAGEPVLSPDGRRFVTLSLDLEAGYQPNLLEIWRMVGGTPRLELSLRSDEWGPSEARWHDDGTIAFLQNLPTDTPGTSRQQRSRVVLGPGVT